MKAAVYFGSHHIYADMIPASKSLLINTDVDKIYLLIEDDVFPYELPDSGVVETINISELIPQIFVPNGPNYKTEWTYIGLIRAALTKVFPNLDRILSIDCDTIVREDISDLWDLNLDDYYFAGVQEPHMSNLTHGLYINAGMMMCNLKKLREDGKDDEMIQILNTKRLYFVAQDAINAVCRDHILGLSGDYNSCPYTIQSYNQKVLHFAGIRGTWRDYPIVKHYREIPWSEIRI